jgi:hypothetical protein
MISISVDTKEVQAMFKEVGSKLPKVMADTVNVLGGMVKEATIDEMRSKFKGGTSNWVLNSFGIKKATQSNQTAEVFYNRGRNFMAIQVDGGDRRNKGAESLLQGKGVMPAGTGYLPGPGAGLDQYGNLSPGMRSKILSYFQAYSGTNSRNNRKGATLRNGVSFFALQQQKGRLHAGVYQRVDDGNTNALRAQRALISKQLIALQGRGFGFAKGSKAGKELRQRLTKQLKAVNNAMLPRGTSMVMAFDKIKPYTPLIKFYEIANKIVSENTTSTFRSVAEKELGYRLSP